MTFNPGNTAGLGQLDMLDLLPEQQVVQKHPFCKGCKYYDPELLMNACILGNRIKPCMRRFSN